jgi:hypothetical protein
MVKEKNLLRQIILEEMEQYLLEDTSIATVASLAISKFVSSVQKMPSLVNNVSKLKIERSGSFYSIILIDKRNQRIELVKTPVEQVANKLLPQIQDAIVKLTKQMRKNKIGS